MRSITLIIYMLYLSVITFLISWTSGMFGLESLSYWAAVVEGFLIVTALVLTVIVVIRNKVIVSRASHHPKI